MLKGIAASDGIGIGKVFIIKEHSLEYTQKTITDIKSEKKRFSNAVEVFCRITKKQAEMLEKSTGKKESEIMLSYISIVKDPYLISETEKIIETGKCSEYAVDKVCDKFISMFADTGDELIQQRTADISDVKKGILSILLGKSKIKLNDIPKGTVIVAKELTPSMTAEMNKENIVGIVTEKGGENSHSAILARIFEIPAVLGSENAVTLLQHGNEVIVDGSSGIVIPSPDSRQLKEYIKKRKHFINENKELKKYKGKKTISASGEEYKLLCNIGSHNDAVKAIEHDGEGIGLFRTEYFFMDRNTLPTEEEQFEAYKRTALTLKGKTLVIRTLDIGGDKEIPYLGLKKEENPFMGLRAIRYCLKNTDIFKTQLRAILRASAYGDVKIMFPMITCVEEIRQGKALVQEAKSELRRKRAAFDENIKIGIMIETPSAAIISDILAKECNFFSIGTNDLTGYTMACDRGNNDISNLYSVFQPSVLKLVQIVISAARKNNIPVEICGEAASNPMMIPLLISFGINELSVSPPMVLRTRKSISEWTKARADETARNVMKFSSENEIKNYLKTVT